MIITWLETTTAGGGGVKERTAGEYGFPAVTGDTVESPTIGTVAMPTGGTVETPMDGATCMLYGGFELC